MRINQNISSLNIHRQMNQLSQFASKSMERLSSGLRINRASDDAAGLAISENMRAQIRGLSQAVRNTQDAISFIQTGEGALNETHSILQRMRELAVQSANDTNTLEDRKKLQSEMDQLSSEISRISNSTEFNRQNLLGGSFNGTFHIGANSGQHLRLAIVAMDAKSLGVAEDVASVSAKVIDTSAGIIGADLSTGSYFAEGEYNVEFNGDSTEARLIDWNQQIVATADIATPFSPQEITFRTAEGYELNVMKNDYDLSGESVKIQIGSSGADLVNDATNTARLTGIQLEDSDALESGRYALRFTSGGTSVEVVNLEGNQVLGTLDNGAPFNSSVSYEITLATGKTIAFSTNFFDLPEEGQMAEFIVTENDYKSGVSKVGSDTDGDGQLDHKATVIKGVDLRTQPTANQAITTIDQAIEAVSAARSAMGAVQNRLEHTINNLTATSENLTAAESRIRDADLAKEMMAFTKNNILSQAAQAMMVQSNQQPQSVLQLLQ